MPEYLTPGVYIEEPDKGTKPIEPVGTAMPAFVGFTERAVQNGKPELITSWNQYVQKFGDFINGAYLPLSVYGYFQNGGTRCYVVSVKQLSKPEAKLDVPTTEATNKEPIENLGEGTNKNLALKPANLGIIVRGKQGDITQKKQLRVTIRPPELIESPKDEPTSSENSGQSKPSERPDTSKRAYFCLDVREVDLAHPDRQGKLLETFRNVSLIERDYTNDAGETIRQVKEIECPNGVPFRSRTIDVIVPEKTLAEISPVVDQTKTLELKPDEIKPAEVKDFQGIEEGKNRSGIAALQALDDVTMLVVPDLMTLMKGQSADDKKWREDVRSVQTLMLAHCINMKDRLAILDTPPGMEPTQVFDWRMSFTGFDTAFAAMYYPWIKVSDPVTNAEKLVPPSGHIAGIWARNDITRGVHKAPANEVVQLAVGVEYDVSYGEQQVLNPRGINCIRPFPGRGIRVWGARTLSSDPSWRYVNVRRLFNYVEKSIERSTQWVVFEPNEPRLWGRIRRDVGAFLTNVWRDGMLFGLTPEEAFYVKCDEEINPLSTRDLGHLYIEIGLAPVKPAEFVIFRISQWAGPNSEV